MLPERVPLLESFYSIETDEPIETCQICDRSLLDGNTEYLVEKGVRRFEEYDVQETIFGYAICLDCHAQMRQSFSDHSRRRCQAYLNNHVDLARRTGALLRADEPDPHDWMRRCVVHDTPRDKLHEYQVLAHCHGTDMLLSHLPVLIGGPAIDDLTDCLSNETIDDLGGFRDEHFGPSPELERDLHGPALV